MVWKVMVSTGYEDTFCKKEFSNNKLEKAERFGLDLSRKHPRWKIQIIKGPSGRKPVQEKNSKSRELVQDFK
jgi:hypothetical protein